MIDHVPGVAVDKMLVEKYASDFSIPRELAEIVARRYPEYSEAKKYLFPSLEHLHDPVLMPDIRAAVDEIIATVKKGEGILIYTHDDVDGYTSAAVVYKALNDITRGSDSVYVYPIVREKDGYILNPEVLKSYWSKGVRLLLTVDFGISNDENFRIAEQEGLRAIICDHHETALTSFPLPAVNPKRPDSRYPFRELAGVGVAFKLAQYLYQKFFGVDADEFYGLKRNFFPIVCIGTFSDRVMLRDENRVFTIHGMQLLNEIDEAWALCLRQAGPVDINRLLREVIPTLGSAAYIDPRLGLEFFIEKDMGKVAQCYNTLRETDQERRQAIDTLFSDVVSSAEVSPRLVLSVVPLSKQHYLGSVAARLRDYYKRNAVIIGLKDDKCVGELRSCGLDLYELLHNFRDMFIDFGGHKKAAGFSMRSTSLERLLDNIREYIKQQGSETENGCGPNDPVAETRLRRTDVGILQSLAPFGEGNPAPVLTDGVSRYTIDNTMRVSDID
jgi:single-stranded-DNA-specific exonuclease